MDLVEWLLELRLYAALKTMRGLQWFCNHQLEQWYHVEQQVERTQTDFPDQPIGEAEVLLGDIAILNRAIFDTQLKASALWGALSVNWYIHEDILVALLLAVMCNPNPDRVIITDDLVCSMTRQLAP